MSTSTDGTWIGQTPAGLVVARLRADECTVDRPRSGRYREPYPVTVHDGCPIVDGTPLRRVVAIGPEVAAACGWYSDHDGVLLLTQIPDSSLGEPMVLLNRGDRVVRAHPVDPSRLYGEDGSVVDLGPDGLRVTNGDTVVRSVRSPRYSEYPVTFGTGLSGTVIVPNTAGPHPAAVIVHGAAGGHRDLYRLFAQPLLDADMAALIYDKPGYLDGHGHTTIFQQADAADAGLDLLAARPDVDPARIGLLGFSNGMWAVPMVAARRPDVAFVAGLGAPGATMVECEVHRRTTVLRAAGVGADTATAAGEAWRCILGIVATGGATADLTDRLDHALRTLAAADDLSAYEIPEYARENPMVSAIPPLVPVADLVADLVAMVSGRPEAEVGYDPVCDYARMRCPVSLHYGGSDSNVPVATSVRRIEKALVDAGIKPAIHVYPGLEHLLNVVPEVSGLTPETAMHGFHQFRFGPRVWPNLTDWLRRTVGPA